MSAQEIKGIGSVTASGPLTKPEEIGDRVLVITHGEITTTKFGEAARIHFYFQDDESREERTTLLSSNAIQDQVKEITRKDAWPVRAVLDSKYSEGRQQNYYVLNDPPDVAAEGATGADDDIPF